VPVGSRSPGCRPVGRPRFPYGVTTGTADRDAALKALYEHAFRAERPANSTDAQLAAVMQNGSANVIRHTVRTWLAEHGVPDSEADMFMGRKEEGSERHRQAL
jgi:hypothetical protein